MRREPRAEFAGCTITSLERNGGEELNLKFSPAALSFRCRCDRADLVHAEQRNLSVAIRERRRLALLSQCEIRLQAIKHVGDVNSSLRELRNNLRGELFVPFWCALNLYPFTQRPRGAPGSLGLERVPQRVTIRSAPSQSPASGENLAAIVQVLIKEMEPGLSFTRSVAVGECGDARVIEKKF